MYSIAVLYCFVINKQTVSFQKKELIEYYLLNT
jgi:hypothetical protein